MSDFSFSTKLEILPPKIEMKDNTPKMKRAMKSAIVAGMVKATAYVQRDLKLALDKTMDSSIWNWNGLTLRKNGQTVNTPRNIVDTGALKKSLIIIEKYLQTKTTLQIKYRSPYAALVHYGGVVQPYGNRNANSVLIPARPWIDATLRGNSGATKFNMSKPMNQGFNEVWSKKFG